MILVVTINLLKEWIEQMFVYKTGFEMKLHEMKGLLRIALIQIENQTEIM